MTTIYKYPLEIKETQGIALPIGGNILSVQMQGDKPCLWVLVESDAPKKTFTVKIYGTGQPVNYGNLHYIGTVQDGLFVWHVFLETDYCMAAFTPSLK